MGWRSRRGIFRACSLVVVAGFFAAACFDVGSLSGTTSQDAGDDTGSVPDSGAGSDTGGACTDASSDPDNCGACGHSCKGGTCSSGLCDPTTIASGQIAPSALAVNDSWIAWNTNAEISGCLKTGCVLRDGGPGVPLLSGPSTVNASALAIDSDHVYFTTNTPGMQLRRGGLDDTTQDLVASLSSPGAITIDPTGKWFVFVGGASIQSCGPTTSLPCTPFGESAQVNNVAEIAVGATRVYWRISGASGAIESCLLSQTCGGGGPAPDVVASAQANPSSIAIDSTRIFWTNKDDGSVMMRTQATDAGAALALATGQNAPSDIVSDGTRAYWVNAGDGTVMACDVGGCAAPTLVAKGLAQPTAIAADADFLYVVAAGSGQIVRIAKL